MPHVSRLQALAVYFFLAGFALSNWTVRIPNVKDHIGATATALGVALLCQSLGGLISMYVGGRLAVRFGPRPIVIAAGALTCACVVIPTLVPNTVGLALALVALGVSYGTFNIGLNSAAVELERELGRSVMPTLHGLFSGGSLGGAVVGGFAAARLSPTAHVGTIAVLALVTAAVFARPLLAARAGDRAPGADRRTGGSKGGSDGADGSGRRAVFMGVPGIVLVFALIAFCSAIGEFSAIDWATLHLKDNLGASSTVAAWGLACYECAMTAGRLTGARLIGRYGQAYVLGGGACLALTGGLVAAHAGGLPGSVAFAYVGYLALGFGMANVFPIAIAWAGAVGGPLAVSRTAMAASLGIMLERPIIGFLADRIGLPWALSFVAVLIATIAVVGLVVRPNVPIGGPRPAPLESRDGLESDAVAESDESSEGGSGRSSDAGSDESAEPRAAENTRRA